MLLIDSALQVLLNQYRPNMTAKTTVNLAIVAVKFNVSWSVIVPEDDFINSHNWGKKTILDIRAYSSQYIANLLQVL